MWIAALAGAYMSYEGANKQAKAMKGGGNVDLTTSATPWGPDQQYRQFILDRGGDYLGIPRNDRGQYTGYAPQFRSGDIQGAGSAPPPAGAPAPAGGAKAGRGRGGSGGGGQQGFQGYSPESAKIRDEMANLARQGNPLYGESEDYISDTLAGNDRNPYRGQAMDFAQNYDNPTLRRFQEMLFSGQMSESPGGQAAQGGGAPLGPHRDAGGRAVRGADISYRAGGDLAPGGSASGSGPVGVDAALRDIIAGNEAPGTSAIKERIRRENQEALAQQVKELRMQGAGSGMYGGQIYQGIEGDVRLNENQRLLETLGGLDYGSFQNALGLGTSYDIAALDRAAAERASRSSNATARYGVDQERASRAELARLSALGGSIEAGMGMDQFRGNLMGGLAGGFSSDQQFALGGVPAITGLGMRDFGAAGDMSMGLDNLRNQRITGDKNAAAMGAGARAENNRLNFDRERYYADKPLRDLGIYSSIVGDISNPFIRTHQQGTDRRSGQSVPPNPYAAGLSGAASGAALYGMYNSYGGQGSRSYGGSATGYQYINPNEPWMGSTPTGGR